MKVRKRPIPVYSSLRDGFPIMSDERYKIPGEKAENMKPTYAGKEAAADYIGCSLAELEELLDKTGCTVCRVAWYHRPSAKKANKAAQLIFSQPSLDALREEYTTAGRFLALDSNKKRRGTKKSKTATRKVSTDHGVGYEATPAPAKVKKTGKVTLKELTMSVGKGLSPIDPKEREHLTRVTICPKLFEALGYTTDLVLRVIAAKLFARYMNEYDTTELPEDVEVGLAAGHNFVDKLEMVSVLEDITYSVPVAELLK